MQQKTLSIFVDESGILRHPDASSRFYILTLVLHDQSIDIKPLVSDLDRDMYTIGVNDCFHAGPVIRREEGFAALTWELRNRIFSRMMGFARRLDFRYRCLFVDKKYVASTEQIISRLSAQLHMFLDLYAETLNSFDSVKVYYDCGQSCITNLLHRVFVEERHMKVDFAQNVKPRNYKLFQVADLVCSVKLIELKLLSGEHLTLSESKFFGGPRRFLNTILRRIKVKELET